MYYFFWDWRVDIIKIFADMYNVFFSTGREGRFICHFVAALSARWFKDRSCISRRTRMYCELWGPVRMSKHCDVTFTEWGPPLPLILSTIAFDECTGWLSFIWCISLICTGDLIGYLIGVTTFVKQHIHYNQILLCNSVMAAFQNKIEYIQFNAQEITSMFIISI